MTDVAKKPYLSVCVAAYNIEKYIGTCIQSLVTQTFHDMEIIVVDDGSKDKTGGIADGLAKKDSRIRVVHKANGGIVAARKTGLEYSCGEYITFVDGDDWLEKNYYQKMCASIEESGGDVDIAIGGLTVRNLDESVRSTEYTILDYGVYNRREILGVIAMEMMCDHNSFRQKMSPSMCVKIFRRGLLENILPHEDEMITLGDDAAVSYMAVLDSKKICIVDCYGYNYRYTPNSMTKRGDPLYYERLGHFRSFVKDELLLRGYCEDSEIYTQYARYALYLYWRQLKVDVGKFNLKNVWGGG